MPTASAGAPEPLAELIAAGEDARLELVDGALAGVETSGEHADAQLGVGAPIRSRYHRAGGGDGAAGGWWIYVEPTVQLTLREVYRPDLAGWRRDRTPDRPVGFPIHAVPDWVCEVLSPSNAAHDLSHKRRAYHAAKVGHYWLVDPMRETVTVMQWSLDGYVIVEVDPTDGVLRPPPFPDAPIELAGLFGR